MVVYFPVVLMRRMMKRQMQFMIPLIEEWMIEEKKGGKLSHSLGALRVHVQILNTCSV